MNTQEIINGLDRLYAENKSEQVEDYLSGNLEQALQEKDVGTAITIINELIGYYRDSSQYDKAEIYCEKLLPFMERAGLQDTIHYGTSCLNIANAYRAAGKLEESLNHYQMVFDIYAKVLEPGDYRFAGLYNNLSLLYQEMGEFDKACESLQQALAIIKKIPEALVEQAVTYTNLAASYVKAGRLTKAQEAAKEGLAIFQNGMTEDFHYSASLAVMGDICFAKKEYEQAVSCFEQAMTALKQHVGLTHAYFRLASNLQTTFDAMGKPDALRGMTISREYYDNFGKPAFGKWEKEWKTSDSEETFCYAKVGEGSECFGFDDIISKDHDFGPGFCVFVSKSQYEKYGVELEAIYNGLPENYKGFSRPKKFAGAPRNGIIVVEDFMKRILSLEERELVFLIQNRTLPEETWIRLEDWRLCTVTNGAIFDGEDSLFGSIYAGLKGGYPEVIRRKKIAQKVGEICQEGQYNYPRLMQRQDECGAMVMLHSFEEHTVELLYLLNCVYAPHKKWLMKGAESLSKGQKVLEDIKSLMRQIPDEKCYQNRELVDWIGTTNKDDYIYTVIQQIASEIVELLWEEGLTKSHSIYLEDHIPYLLELG